MNTAPTILVVFGATGDLMAKKIAPSLYRLSKGGHLPELFTIIGFSRRKISSSDFRKHVGLAIEKKIGTATDHKHLKTHLLRYTYQTGNFTTVSDYHALAKHLGRVDNEWKTCTNKLFYLAVPPQYYQHIFNHLADSGLTIPCGPDGGWTRVLVEKPFGQNLSTAEALDTQLAALFQEEQIYRIDHYLAKNMLQNILTFRFSNNILESAWNARHIESVKIKIHETEGLEGRGSFFDGVGALRDMGQSHLLQMLSLIAMDNPGDLSAQSIRKKRAELLSQLRILMPEEIRSNTTRAQYEGYTNHNGVQPDSQTETFFQLTAYIDSPRWAGVPFVLEEGKRMKKAEKEIVVTFRHTTPCLCPENTEHFKNTVVFHLEPEEKIAINFLTQSPHIHYALETKQFAYSFAQEKDKHYAAEEYERLLLDCIKGNQVLFISTEEVQAMWSFIDPIVNAWKQNEVPLLHYSPGAEKILPNPSAPTHSHTIADSKKLGIIGLGKMGAGIAQSLIEKGWHITGYNRSSAATRALSKNGLIPAYSIAELMHALPRPRVVWIMVPAGHAVDEVLFGSGGIMQYAQKGDIIIDAGNSHYTNSIKRHKRISSAGVMFVDVGVSGGPQGARTGACLMIGGTKQAQSYLAPLYIDLAVPGGFALFPGVGAGHFAKMVHNGIEYGMMEAIAEGFAVLQASKYNYNLQEVAHVYNHGSVITSRLISWLWQGFTHYGTSLSGVSATVGHSGEGEWTIKAAEKLGVPVPVITASLNVRKKSAINPTFSGKILTTMRNQFGGHSIDTK